MGLYAPTLSVVSQYDGLLENSLKKVLALFRPAWKWFEMLDQQLHATGTNLLPACLAWASRSSASLAINSETL